jgi:serine O-acetyltransferase
MDRKFIIDLFKARNAHQSIFPPKYKVEQFLEDLLELLFPHFGGERDYFAPEEIAGKFALIERDLKKILKLQQPNLARQIDKITGRFFQKMPEIYRLLWLDAQAIHEGDPASESVDEVISAYPGFFAIYTYRVAHEFYLSDIPVFPRLLTEFAHYRTGIDINPGARIGESFFIDHGTGVVVGETTIIGNNVKLYQGVTLGALSVQKNMSKIKRHPTIEDNVIIYSNATILGGDTVVGHDSVIGGNVWLTHSVPPYSMVYHSSEVKVQRKTSRDIKPHSNLKKGGKNGHQ